MAPPRIPSVAHFIWFGKDLPWVYALALRSAALRGGFDRVAFHHEPALVGCPTWGALERIRGIELRRMQPEDVLAECPDGDALVDLFRQLEEPAARANMVRAALLYTEGGVYLDTDTVTVGSFTPLRGEAGAFCGREHVVFPAHVKRSGNPAVRATAAGRSIVRSVFRELPDGWRAFRRVEGSFPTAVNNAVLASEPGHPFIADLLRAMLEVPPERRRVRYALGTHLLQEVVASHRGGDLRVHDPAVFYPLGPEISAHWFRLGGRPALDEVLRDETRLVHWYASVRTREIVPRIDPAWVARHADRQLFSALALPLLDDVERAALRPAQDRRPLLRRPVLGLEAR